MLLPVICVAVTTVLTNSQAVAQDGVANERIPVTRQQLEQHWGVDCVEIKADIFKRAKLNSEKNVAGVSPTTTVVDTVFLQQLENRLLQCSIIADRFRDKQEPSCHEFLSAKNLLSEKLRQAVKNEINIKNEIYSQLASLFRC